jgi:hypothetical protein
MSQRLVRRKSVLTTPQHVTAGAKVPSRHFIELSLSDESHAQARDIQCQVLVRHAAEQLDFRVKSAAVGESCLRHEIMTYGGFLRSEWYA